MSISLNREAIQEWVDALRSGKYEQTKGSLQKDGKFCCLGVACDIFADRVGLKEVHRSGEGTRVGYWYATDDEQEGKDVRLIEYSVLPPTVAEFLGFSGQGWEAEVDPEVSFGGGDWCSLTQFNDTMDYNFEQIARVIEEYFLGEERTDVPAA